MASAEETTKKVTKPRKSATKTTKVTKTTKAKAPEQKSTKVAQTAGPEKTKQVNYIKDLIDNNQLVTITFVNGRVMKAIVIGMDSFTIMAKNNVGTHLVFKSSILAITTVNPNRPKKTADSTSTLKTSSTRQNF